MLPGLLWPLPPRDDCRPVTRLHQDCGTFGQFRVLCRTAKLQVGIRVAGTLALKTCMPVRRLSSEGPSGSRLDLAQLVGCQFISGIWTSNGLHL
jgi:hypothetical protein